VNLRKKIVLLTVVPVVLVMTAIVWLGLRELHDRLIDAEREEILAELSNAAKVIDQGAREALSVARLMARAQESGLFGRRQDSIQLAREILDGNPQFVGASIGYEPNADGGDRAYLSSRGPDDPSSDATGRFLPYWYRNAAEGGELTLEPLVEMESALYYDGLKRQYLRNRQASCIVTEPYVYNERNLVVEHTCVIEIDGEFRGMTGIDRSLDAMSGYLRDLRPLETAELVLISGQGRIIATSLGGEYDRNLRTARLADLYLDADGGFVTDIYRVVGGKKEIDPGKADAARFDTLSREFQTSMNSVLETANTGSVVDVVSPVSGMDDLGAAAAIPLTGWKLAMLVPVETVDGAIRATVMWVAAVALMGILAAVWLLVRLANTLAGRIQSIGSMARDVADGDLTARVEADSDDETGRLQTAIHDMIRSLSSLLGKVKRSSISLTSASNDMTAGRRRQASAIEEFGSSTAEIAGAAKQISGTSRELFSTMSGLSKVAGETAGLAGEGRAGLSRMSSTMTQLNAGTSSMSSRLEAISQRAGNINGVVTTIVKVADQTNLLSLNAAVEAEKAGEFGRGFSVVAHEISRLADQTARATLDVESIVNEMHDAVSGGVMEMEKFSGEVRQASVEIQGAGLQLKSIIDRVGELTSRFGSVMEGMDSQSEGARQISDALVGLSEGIEQTRVTLEGYRKAEENLDEAVTALRQEISRFRMEEAAARATPAPDEG